MSGLTCKRFAWWLTLSKFEKSANVTNLSVVCVCQKVGGTVNDVNLPISVS